MEIVLKLSPLAQNDHLKPKLSFFWSFWNETRTETPLPPPLIAFLLAMATQKYILTMKKIWIVEVLLDMDAFRATDK